MEVKKDIMWRVYLVFFLFCLIGLVIIGRIIQIQFVEGDYWKSRADSLSTDIRSIEASRGNIFSSDGRLLATSVPSYDIRIDLKAPGITRDLFHLNVQPLSEQLSALFQDKSPALYRMELSKAYSEGDRYFLLKRGVSFREMMSVKQMPLLNLGKYKGGLIVVQKNIRQKPFYNLALRTIGEERAVKPVGIEAAYNEELKGTNGKRLMQRIAGGVWMPMNDRDEIEPKNGKDIITTIDVNIQDVAEDALTTHLLKHNAQHGCVVLMEVATGEIKAISNLTRTSSGSYSEEFNYAIAESTEPGSTMKLPSLLCAIDDGFINPNETVAVGNGYYSYFGQPMKDAHPPKKPVLTVKEAFMTSSNVGISKLVYQSYAKNPQRFIDKLNSFGLNEKLGLQIPGEGKPRVKNTSDKDWSAVSLPWMAIGYEVKITPLQTLAFYNAIANNGKMMKPILVKEIIENGKSVWKVNAMVLRDSILKPSSIKIAKEFLEAVVDSGSATVLKNPYYKVAGKTGTAQRYSKQDGFKTNTTYQATFAGYFPADNPKYSCIVVIYAPSGGAFYGGAVAAPVFREIADKIYSNQIELHNPLAKTSDEDFVWPTPKQGERKSLQKVLQTLQVPVEANNAEASYVKIENTEKGLVLKEKEFRPGLVPDVTGMSARDAFFLLENNGLRVRVSGRGVVTRQSLKAGSAYQKGDFIEIILS